ncbi:MAG TPA: MazG family protein [Acidimicrobiales bacterium]|nr:MazG family protein [Acidimicrobiales bacterium]
MIPRVVVVGLGPAGPELVTAATTAAVDRVAIRFVRTRRHPAADIVEPATSFDEVYERAERIDGVYRTIVDELVRAAGEHGEVLYAVPGSPAVAERTVVLLREEAAAGRIELAVVPALSFADLAWVRLGIDPLERGVRILDGRRFAVEAAGQAGPLLVAQCDSPAVLSDVKLALDLDGPPIVVLQRLGAADETITTVSRSELDRSVVADHLTTLWIDGEAPAVASEVARFDELVQVLRERCPWDREQTHQTLTRHLLEETYEVLDAIENLDVTTGDGYEHLEEELGDLLFQICFHATLASESGAFTLADVARGIHDKLVIRHPHVFAGVEADDASTVMRNWEQIKMAEKGRDSIFDGIPSSLPSLLYAHKVVRKAQTLGVDVALPTPVPAAGDIGAALLAVVAAARALDVDPEAALRAATAQLRDRGRATEQQA